MWGRVVHLIWLFYLLDFCTGFWTGSLLLDVPQNQSQDKLHNKPAVRQQDDFTVDAERLGKKGENPRDGEEMKSGEGGGRERTT